MQSFVEINNSNLIQNVFAFPCTVVGPEYDNHCKLVEIKHKSFKILVFLYCCCTSFTSRGMSSARAWDEAGFAH